MNQVTTWGPVSSSSVMSEASQPPEQQSQAAEWNAIEAVMPVQQLEISRTKQIILIVSIVVSALVFLSGIAVTVQSMQQKAHFDNLQRNSRIVVL